MASLNKASSKEVTTLSVDGKMPSNFLTAGFKVMDKAGGPELLVTGFANELDTISSIGEIHYHHQVFQKVFFNSQRKQSSELIEGGTDTVYSYHFFPDMNDNWEGEVKSSNTLYFVCKYWDVENSKFTYLLKTFVEIISL